MVTVCFLHFPHTRNYDIIYIFPLRNIHKMNFKAKDNTDNYRYIKN